MTPRPLQTHSTPRCRPPQRSRGFAGEARKLPTFSGTAGASLLAPPAHALACRLWQTNLSLPVATTDIFRAKENATRVGIMRHGKLAHILTAAELRHTDLEKLYLETMAA